MAEIMDAFAAGVVGRRIELDPAVRRIEEARDQPKQRGLAGAVGAGDDQRFAGRQRERNVGKYPAAAAICGESGGAQPQLRQMRARVIRNLARTALPASCSSGPSFRYSL